jgi:beta-lactamase superfamily II metal-dependent hydrolase
MDYFVLIKMKNIMIMLIMGMLLFGCIDDGTPEEPPVVPDEPGENETEDPGVIIDEQENETVKPPVVPDEPEEPPEEVPDEPTIDYTEDPDAVFTVYFIDSGGSGSHGESVLIKKGDFEMLVDAGNSKNAGRVVDFLKARDVDDIDVLLLSSGNPGHYGGVSAVLSEYEVEEFWWAGGSTFADSDYADAVDAASSAAEATVEVEEGYKRTLNGFDFEVFNPPDERYSDKNNDAVVTHVRDKNFTMLLMSSIQTGPQHRIINKYPDKTEVDVFQAPYFGLGAGTAQFGIFLQTSVPEVVVITGSSDDSATAGGSREPFLRYLEQYDVPSYKTYLGGDVQVTSDGNSFSIRHLD